MAEYRQIVQHREGVTTTGPTSFVGTVKVVIFERSLFRIISVAVEDANFEWDQETITVKGQLGEVVEGDRYEFEGRVVDDQRYGLQFSSTGCHVVLPQTSSQLLRYFKFHHVNLNYPRKSTKLVFDAFGGQAMNIVLDNPDSLDEIIEIDAADRKTMIDFFAQLDIGNSTGQIIKKLQQYGFTERQVNLIFDQYGVKTLATIQKNPYQLAIDLFDSGLRFSVIDQIAQRYYSITALDKRRLQGALLYALKLLINGQGGAFAQRQVLLSLTNRLLNYQVDQSNVERQLSPLVKQDQLEIENDQHVYESAYYNAEWKVAQKLFELLQTDDEIEHVEESEFQEAIQQIEKQNGYDYDQVQIDAIQEALNHSVMLLTGGPGTGKTTIVNGIVASFLALHPKLSREDVMLVAPTGRAAKQINSVTGIEASTIHRLLGLTADISDRQLMEMDFDPLDAQLLIVDEMSMTSMALFTALMDAVTPGTHVVLVGDCDQLPSVGPGQVFHDLLATDALPQRRLTHIYRQAKTSSIIPLANRINQGKVDANLFAPAKANQYPHRQFIRAHLQAIPSLIARAVQLYRDQHRVSLMDLQILAPIHGGVAGTKNLNQVLQDALNPPEDTKPAIKLAGHELRVGDKVMQTVNDPDRNVFNGDIGIIKSIEGQNVLHGQTNSTAKQKVIVDFDGEEVEYLRINELNALQLAYCTTIHKAQGSQSAVVIIVMADEFFPSNPNAPTIMQRNLLYTAVTRSSQALLMVGSPAAFVRCANAATQYRQTTLTKRIQLVFDHQEQLQDHETKTADPKHHSHPSEEITSTKTQQLTAEMIENNLIDPLIGMDGMTPEDF
ncbi:SF1B family DNA helicase RecD2 [Limosilactobacillus caecicola]|uniref:SF1B family DNA helicase RecD2 n=1 Tax=Limosilactobacillus caecicola TaxID=2941332 RepID=UPI00203FD829|nr:ATP-dependent RecD-like DNA helicase [Limosilactobacillus caecicola]